MVKAPIPLHNFHKNKKLAKIGIEKSFCFVYNVFIVVPCTRASSGRVFPSRKEN